MFSKNPSSALLVISICGFILIESSLAIKCWDCDSYTDKNCGDPFDNRTLSVTDCNRITDGYHQQCRKITQKINGGIKYTRGCLIDDHSSRLSEVTIDLCSTDGCNTAPGHVPFTLMIFATPLIIHGIWSYLMVHSMRTNY